MEAVAVAGSALLVSLFVFGVEPALKVTFRQNLSTDLVMDSATVGAPRQPRQQRLIRWQVAISVCFFLIVVMVARVLATEGQSDHRVPLKCLTIVALDFRVLGWTEVRARQTVQSALGIISLRPETEAVAAYSGLGPRTPLASLTPVPSGRRQSMYMLAATSGIFDAFSIPLVRGRGFSGTDDARAPLVIVVSERTARTLFETTDVVGKQVTFQTRDHLTSQVATVIGVAQDTDCGELVRRNDDVVYVPWVQQYEAALTIASRTNGDPDDAVRGVQASIRQADPNF
jgi:MacB-like periplasmic core domain